MKFLIQPGNPLWKMPDELAAEYLSEAIEAVFPMDTEDAMIIWGDESVSVSYKYDISLIIEDVLFMLEALTAENRGEETVFFSSDTFNAEWHLKWHEGMLFIHPVWRSVVGNRQEKLNELGVMEVSTHHFFEQWAKILEKICEAVIRCDMSLEDSEDLDVLLSVLNGREQMAVA